MIRLSIGRRLAAGGALVALASCSAGGSTGGARRCLSTVRRATASPIQHVVFVIQENRSFNNLFMGYPGATTQNYGYDQGGNKIMLHSQSLATAWDISHMSLRSSTACDGTGRTPGTHCKLDGWNSEQAGLGHPPNFAYAYVPKKQIQPYWKLAQQYVLADEAFPSNLDGSFVAHQYAVAAFSSRAVDVPSAIGGDAKGWKSDTIGTLTKKRTYGPRVFPCFDNPTIAGEADAAGLSWRFYAMESSTIRDEHLVRRIKPTTRSSTDPIGMPTSSIRRLQFLKDVANGNLANVTWIAPTFVDLGSSRARRRAAARRGSRASSTRVGKSKFWRSTAIFIMWDDWGGWFDPVPPVGRGLRRLRLPRAAARRITVSPRKAR